MTPPGLYRWPQQMRFSYSESTGGNTFGCDVWLHGEFSHSVTCDNAVAPPGAGSLNPGQAFVHVGTAPDTPADLTYPADGAVVNADVYLADFDPLPDWVSVNAYSVILAGPSPGSGPLGDHGPSGGGYYVGCRPVDDSPFSNYSGGCGGFTPSDLSETITINKGVFTGTSVIKPPVGTAYDATEEGSTLWPYSEVGDLVIDFEYDGNAPQFSIAWTIILRPYWEVVVTPPPASDLFTFIA